MRTTLVLPDVLMREVAQRATLEARSLKSVVAEALSLGLHKKAGTSLAGYATPIRWEARGSTTPKPGR